MKIWKQAFAMIVELSMINGALRNYYNTFRKEELETLIHRLHSIMIVTPVLSHSPDLHVKDINELLTLAKQSFKAKNYNRARDYLAEAFSEFAVYLCACEITQF